MTPRTRTGQEETDVEMANNNGNAPQQSQSQSTMNSSPSRITTTTTTNISVPQEEEGIATNTTNDNDGQVQQRTNTAQHEEALDPPPASIVPSPSGRNSPKVPLVSSLPAPPGLTPTKTQKQEARAAALSSIPNLATLALPTTPQNKDESMTSSTTTAEEAPASQQVETTQQQSQQPPESAASTSTPNPNTNPTAAQQPQPNPPHVATQAYNQGQIDEYLQQGIDNVSATFSSHITQPVHNFFYPHSNRASSPTNNGGAATSPHGDTPAATSATAGVSSPPPPPPLNQSPNNPSWYSSNSNNNYNSTAQRAARRQQLLMQKQKQREEDQKWMENFWKTYDDIVILSIFGQLGIVFRLAAANWFAFFDDTFSSDSALFTNLPLNCLSCFLMGFLGSGNDVIEIVNTRKTLQVAVTPCPSQSPPQPTTEERRNSSGLPPSPSSPEFIVKSPLSNSVGSPTTTELAAAEAAAAAQLLNNPTARSIHHADVDDDVYMEGDNDDDDDDSVVLGSPPKTPSPLTTHSKPSSVGSLRRRTRQQIQDEYDQQQEQQPFPHLQGYEHHHRRKGRLASKYAVWRTTNKVKRAAAEAAQSAEDELREVQLQALERRIRASPCLVLFPGSKEAMDVMEHYHNFEDSPNNTNFPPRRRRRRRQQQQRGPSYQIQSQISPTASPPSEPQSSLYDLELQEENEEDNQEGGRGGGVANASPTSSNSNGMATPPPKMKQLQALSSINEQQQPQECDDDEEIDAMNDFVQHSTRSVPNGMTVDENEQVGQGQMEISPSMTRRTLTPPPNGGQRLRTPHSDGLDHFVHDVTSTIGTNLSRMQRINIADGWDVGTTPEAMSDDLLLGLRIGFCGALSSFTSWNSSMVNLLKSGQVGEAIVGYLIGLQLPIVAYRFGQHAAVYHFVWRVRREARRDDRRGGYGIRIRGSEEDDDDDYYDYGEGEQNSSHSNTSHSNHGVLEMHSTSNSIRSLENGDDDSRSGTSNSFHGNNATTSPTLDRRRKRHQKQKQQRRRRNRVIDEIATERDMPSVRAVATAIFMMALITEVTSIFFFNNPGQQQVAISLLFSPFGVLARWRLVKFNHWRRGFPLGTFACNMLACALSGSLGRLLAGNPGPEESIVVLAMISGFGGSLSSLAAFVREILSGLDPIIFKWDGVTYAVTTLFWGFLIGILTRASNDWADDTTTTTVAAITNTTGTAASPFADDDDGGGSRFLFFHNGTHF